MFVVFFLTLTYLRYIYVSTEFSGPGPVLKLRIIKVSYTSSAIIPKVRYQKVHMQYNTGSILQANMLGSCAGVKVSLVGCFIVFFIK